MINNSFIPNPKKHLIISLLKSFIRLSACMFLILSNFIIAGILLFFAELIGIIEELV